MKFEFPKKTAAEIVETIKEAMGGRQLSDMVNFAVDGSNIKVTISKLGTSVLNFLVAQKNDKTEIELGEEKIAFTHRAFKDEVKQKLVGVITKAGGKVLS